MTGMDWDDPAARARIVEEVGPAAYAAMTRRQAVESTVETVNGHAIRPVGSRFGRLAEAERHAAASPRA